MNGAALDEIVFDLGAPLKAVLALTLALMMFAVALGLKAEHFKAVIAAPRSYMAGVTAQLLGLPLLTLTLCFILHPAPALALGMIMVACCPGGNVSNILTLFARGNTALSVSLTATSSLFAAFLTPVTILFWLSVYPPTADLLQQIQFDIIGFLIQTLIILALPVILGMAVVKLAPDMAARLQRPLALLGGLGLLLVIAVGAWQFRGPLLDSFGTLAPLVLVHNALAFGLGFTAALIVSAKAADRRALTIEVGIQNSGLALVILVTQLGGLGSAVAIVGSWGIWHVIAGMLIVAVFRLREKGQKS